ncbi:hypothetical protein JHW43_005830 [Diplocarpon mali]|nr:hypothetical protein JHW43_005830 [Diplocarpon mali]
MSFADRRPQTQKRRHLEHIRQQNQSAATEQRDADLLDALGTSRAPSLRVRARFHLMSPASHQPPTTSQPSIPRHPTSPPSLSQHRSSVGGPVPIPRHQLIYPTRKHVIPSRRLTEDAWEPSHPRCLEAEPPEMPGSRATRDVKKPSHPRCLGAEPSEMSRSRATRDAWEPSHPRCQEAEPPEMSRKRR